MKEKIALWVSQKHTIPYRIRKSFIKRTYPKILTDHPFEINFYGMKYAGNTKDSTDRLFFMFGGCEKYMLSLMKDYCIAAKSKDFIFLDVGAHVGNHSLFMSQFASHIHAFEPNPHVRDSMNSNIYLNEIQNITVHPIGLSNKNEKIPFYVSQTDHLSVGSFCKDHDARNDHTSDLDVHIGDDIIKQKNISKVDLIKIDVEGYEREVIEGLHTTINEFRPMIIAELSNTTRKSFGSKDDFESIFPNDYNFYQFSGVSREKNHYKIAPFDYSKHKNHLDVIAVPKEKKIYLGNKIINKVIKNKVIGG